MSCLVNLRTCNCRACRHLPAQQLKSHWLCWCVPGVQPSLPRHVVHSYARLETTKMLYLHFLEGCLWCFHSGWLVCLVLQDTAALFYSSCPGTLGKSCGGVKRLGEMLSVGASIQLMFKLTHLMVKSIPQYLFDMKGKVPGHCEDQ